MNMKMNTKSLCELVLSILFVIFVVMDYKLPSEFAEFTSSVIGKMVLLAIIVYLFRNCNPILATLSVVVAFKVMNQGVISKYTPNENKKVNDEGWEYKFGTNWDESNPQIAKVDGNAWLNERKFLGIYSVASSLRNATHDLRRDVPNPQMVVSPWNNTTIMPDANSKGLNTM